MARGVMDIENAHGSGLTAKRDLVIVRGEGARVWDDAGRSYIDCASGHGVANIGHANPAVAEAISRQAATLITLSDVFYSDVRSRVLDLLASIAPDGLHRAFLCNSGTESVEAALKLARLSTGRTGIVAARRGFHGRTMGALSATWEPKYRGPFEPLIPGFSHVAYNDLDAMTAAVGDDTAAVMLEVVQGEGGVYPADPEYLQGVRRLCDERGVMLILDEVQTGFGRTGRMFACQHYGVTPDLLCLAKSIAGGVPMGAVLFGDSVQNIQPGVHGTTFGGNPLACAAAEAAIGYMLEHDLPGQAARKGQWAMERLRRIESPLIREVRGLGLIIGIDLRKRVTPYLRALKGEGVLALPAGSTVLRILPPLVISDEDLATVCDAIEKVLMAGDGAGA
jgi:acetylornithine/LysW-gamma-L-lysine aminotransferase